MRRRLPAAALRLFRVFSLLLLSSLGTVVLTRWSPGYFDDARELDAQHAGTVRETLAAERRTNTPVWPLIQPRLFTSLELLVPSVLAGSISAVVFAALLSAGRCILPDMSLTLAATVFCAVPISVVALFCLLSGIGGPAIVLLLLVASRDFRVFSRLLRAQSLAPHLLYARASGVRTLRILYRHVLVPMHRQIAALLISSVLVGLNAMLPVEVIFGVPGIGQLAWGAAMERDLPVLLAITLLMALCVACAGMLHGEIARAVNA